MHRVVLSGRLIVAALLVGTALPASAQEPRRDHATANRVTLGASLGYGFRVTDDGNLDECTHTGA